MSLMDLYTSRHEHGPPAAGSRFSGRFSPVLWTVLAVILLGTSAGVRAWQDRRFDVAVGAVPPLPFSLKSLPNRVGTWRLIEGAESELDPQVARIAGATDHLVRSYADEQTGVAVSVMISYGNGQSLFAHIPEVCYPSAGYQPATDVADRAIPTASGPATFRSMVFERTGGAARELEESYYSFWHDGRWFPDAAANWKQYRERPAMFKVQAQRKLGVLERRLLDNPTEQFLSAFVSVLESKLAGGAKADPTPR